MISSDYVFSASATLRKIAFASCLFNEKILSCDTISSMRDMARMSKMYNQLNVENDMNAELRSKTSSRTRSREIFVVFRLWPTVKSVLAI